MPEASNPDLGPDRACGTETWLQIQAPAPLFRTRASNWRCDPVRNSGEGRRRTKEHVTEGTGSHAPLSQGPAGPSATLLPTWAARAEAWKPATAPEVPLSWLLSAACHEHGPKVKDDNDNDKNEEAERCHLRQVWC